MQVSCHVQNCVAIAVLESGWMQNDSFYHIWNATGKITECAPRTSCFELPAEQNSCTMMLQYECYNVSNHQQLVGVFNYLFKLPLNPALLFHCERNPPVTYGFSSQRAVTRKAFSLRDVIILMICYLGYEYRQELNRNLNGTGKSKPSDFCQLVPDSKAFSPKLWIVDGLLQIEKAQIVVV